MHAVASERCKFAPSGSVKTPTLRGQAISLRAVTETDVTETYVGWLNDPVVNQFLETRFEKQTLRSVGEFVQRTNASADQYLFAICLNIDGAHIGNIKLGPIIPHHDCADVSLFIGNKQSWGQGYATQAIKLISEFAFEALKLRKLSAGAYAPNTGSISAFLKAGYSTEGSRPRHYLLDGKPCDVVLMGRCRNEESSRPPKTERID